jgi:DNA-binding response OmpR family regulator
MSIETILVIEDDPTLLRVLKDNFADCGYSVQTAENGEEGLQAALAGQADLIVLDIMLPGVNGYEICRRVRQQGVETPIIMLTAKGQEPDIVLGLNLGADDYVTKPFSIKVLLARAAAFLRRGRAKDQEVYRFGQCELHPSSRRLLRNGREVRLTPKEFDLLVFFVRRGGRALTREEILNSVWDHDPLATARCVDRFVSTLRNKTESDPQRPTLITTIRNIGYRFEGAEG